MLLLVAVALAAAAAAAPAAQAAPAASAAPGASTGGRVTGQVGLELRLAATEVAAGEQARVEMTVTWEGPADAYAIDTWGGPEVGGAPLLAESDQLQTEVSGGRTMTRRRAVYPLRADAPGTLVFSPVRVVLRDAGGRSHEYTSRALGLTVLPAAAHVQLTDVALVLAGLGLVGVVVRAARGVRPPAPTASRAQKARARADELRSVGHRDHREFYEACIEALRAGLAADWQIQVRERDRAKVVRTLTDAGFGQERCQATDELLALCDEARFNPEAPPESVRTRALALLATVLSD